MQHYTRQPPRTPAMLPPRPDRLDAVAAASALVGDTEFLWVRSPGESAAEFVEQVSAAAAKIGAGPVRFEVKPRLSEATIIPLRRQSGGSTA